MFQRTRIQLTILNSLVFIILIAILATIIYSYANARMYKDVDQALLRLADLPVHEEDHQRPERMQQDEKGPDSPRFRMSSGDIRIGQLVWDSSGELLSTPLDNPELYTEHEKAFRPDKLNELQDVEVKGFYFRTIATEVADSNLGTVTIQFVRVVNSEQEMLQVLLIILVAGGIISSICAVAAGFFLAGRALVPITNAWQKQQQFVSDASHELRTPLAVIQSRTDLLLRSPSATIQDKVVDISVISKECRRLSKLVVNLLTLARSDSDQLEMDKKEFSLDELLQEITDHYIDIAAYQEKTLELKAAPHVRFVGDRERMHQLIVILIDNAMKYTDKGGLILLSCSHTNHAITVKIKDTGVGIAEEELPKIFDRFYQGDKSRTSTEGAGLGLSIAKWIVDKHYGKIKVTSKLGKGTSFEITFPKNQKL